MCGKNRDFDDFYCMIEGYRRLRSGNSSNVALCTAVIKWGTLNLICGLWC